MNADELRNRFYEFVGPDRFRKFVVALRGRAQNANESESRPRVNRLTYWQEQLWQAFADSVAGVPSEISQIREALLWCDVHQRYLQQGKAAPDSCGVTDREGNYMSVAFMEVCERTFPFGFGFWTLICPDCVDACRAWKNTRKSELTRKPE